MYWGKSSRLRCEYLILVRTRAGVEGRTVAFLSRFSLSSLDFGAFGASVVSLLLLYSC